MGDFKAHFDASTFERGKRKENWAQLKPGGRVVMWLYGRVVLLSCGRFLGERNEFGHKLSPFY